MFETQSGDDVTPSDPGRDDPGRAGAVPEPADGGGPLHEVDVSNEPQGASLGRNIGAMFGSQIVTWSIALVSVSVIPRILGPATIGQFALAGAIWLVVSKVAVAGTSTIVTLDIARDRRSGAAVTGPAILARTCVWMMGAAVVAGYLALSDPDPSLIFVYVWIGIASYINNIGGVAREALQGYERLDAVARTDVISRVLGTGAILVLLLGFGQGVKAIVVVMALMAAVQAILLYLALRPIYRIRLSLDFAAARRVLRRALPFLVTGVLLTAYHQIDIVIMGELVDDDRLGWYSAADRLFGTALFVPTIVMTAVFPVLARLHTDDAQHAKDLVIRAFRTLLVVGVPIGFGAIVLSRPIAELLFGGDFSEAGPVLGTLGIVMMLTFQTVLLGNYAVATGRERYMVVVLAIAIVMTIPLDLVLVPWTEQVYANGAIGGAISYVVTELFMLVAISIKLIPDVFSWVTLARLLRCLAAAAVMVATVWPLRDLFPLFGVAAGAAVYVIALTLQRPFDAEESEALGQMWRRVAAKLPAWSGAATSDQ